MAGELTSAPPLKISRSEGKASLFGYPSYPPAMIPEVWEKILRNVTGLSAVYLPCAGKAKLRNRGNVFYCPHSVGVADISKTIFPLETNTSWSIKGSLSGFPSIVTDRIYFFPSFTPLALMVTVLL